MSQGNIYQVAARWGIGAMMALLLSLPAWAVAADTSAGATPVPTNGTAPAAPNAPQQVALNTPVTFSGNGFAPNDTLSLWEIGPDGSVTPLSGLQTDATGAFSTTVTFAIAGQWQVTAHSITSGNEVVSSYTAGASAAPVASSAPSVTSTAGTTAPQVAVGSPVTFSGNGFTAGEAISLWETGPDTTVTPLANIAADTNGAFSTSVTFPSAGQWQVTARGVSSGNQTVGSYTVGAGGVATAAPSASQTAIGAPVTFSGTGFYAGEAISLWMTGPGGNVTALSGIQADGAGAFSTTVSFSAAGPWAVTAHGITSGKETVGTYSVGTTAGTPVGASGVGINAPQVAVGAPVSFSGTGFSANEAVSLWETAPDSTVTPLSGTQANAGGGVSASVAFPSAGYWQVTAHGTTSGHEVIAGYNVGDGSAIAPVPSSPVSPSAGAPINVTSGTVVNFAAAGFNANEIVNAWTTAPDGTVTPLDVTQASPGGQVTISTSFLSAGRWQVTVHGKDSGHVAVGQYQVTASS
jgi:hypothetical protein